MAATRCELSIVVPAYREETRIARTMQEIAAAFHGRRDWELVVVDDGSPDLTARAAADAAHSLRLGSRVRVVSYGKNQGKGWALRKGVEDSRGRWVAFLDADGEIPAYLLPGYLETARREGAAAVVGSKRHPDSRLEYSRLRVLISAAYSWFNRLFFGLAVKDTQSGIKLFHREALVRVLPRLLGKRFAFDLELLVNIVADGGLVVEAPLVIRGHEGFGRIGARALWLAFWDTLAILYRRRILRYYDWVFLPKPGRRPALTALVAARGWSEELQALVTDLRDQAYPGLEIVVLAEHGEFTLAGARVVGTGPLSRHEQWTLGARRARGSLLVFLDEDARPEPDWLARGADYLAHHELAGACGPAEPDSGLPLAHALTYYARRNRLVSCGDSYLYRLRRQRLARRAVPAEGLFVRKSVFNAVHGFDPVPYQLAVEPLFFEKLAREGHALLYSPDLRCRRRYGAFFGGELRAAMRAARERGRLCQRFHERFCRPATFVAPLVLVALVLGGALSFFSDPFRELYLWSAAGLGALAWLGGGALHRPRGLAAAGATLVQFLAGGAAFLAGAFGRDKEE